MRATIVHSFLDVDRLIQGSSDPSYNMCGNCSTQFNQLAFKITDRTTPAVLKKHRALILENSEASF